LPVPRAAGTTGAAAAGGWYGSQPALPTAAGATAVLGREGLAAAKATARLGFPRVGAAEGGGALAACGRNAPRTRDECVCGGSTNGETTRSAGEAAWTVPRARSRGWGWGV
jgi:hypothetical protein